MKSEVGLGWFGIFRLGLVQAMLGAVVVLTSSTLNRVMVVELSLPALLPGLLLTLHYALQMTRPRMGHGSDVGGRRTPWIVGGMALLALGGFGAAVATAWMGSNLVAGVALGILAYALVGLGVSAAGTSLLVLLAKSVLPQRRAAAATVVWVMMIVGFAVTAGTAGHWLDPYTPERLMAVSGAVSVLALSVAWIAVQGVERKAAVEGPATARQPMDFRAALRQVWADKDARRFTIFVFVSMFAYSMQDLILEPFAGALFGFSLGESTRLSGLQHGGTLAGMLLAALAGRRIRGVAFGSLRAWTVGGCLASGLALLGLVLSGVFAPNWPLRANVFLLGLANGAFAIAAIGSMMSLAGNEGREGTRMGLWGAAQAIGFALGGLVGAAASDLARWVLGTQSTAYASVFLVEALIFFVCCWLAAQIALPASKAASAAQPASHGSEAFEQPRLSVGGTR